MAGSPGFAKLRGQGPNADRTQDNISGQLQPLARALAGTPIMGAPPPAWIQPDLMAGWANSDPLGALIAFHADALDYVHIQGVALDTTGAPNSSVIFTLPIGYRPKQIHLYAGGSVAHTLVIVNPNGDVKLHPGAALGAGLIVGLDFIFLPEIGTGASGGSSGGSSPLVGP